jgi:hypothetical protein
VSAPTGNKDRASYEASRDALRTFLACMPPGARVWYSDPSVPAEPTCASVSGLAMDRRGRALVGRLLRRLSRERKEIEGGRGFEIMSLDDYKAYVQRASSRVVSAAGRARQVAENAMLLEELPSGEETRLAAYAAGLGTVEAAVKGLFEPPKPRKDSMQRDK